ncbi:MAG: hypothetical protein KZQ64_05705 [gamma proteobacterium symbiont of Bathyaustriella thionipta]|nr:hypothetical protein [gamma proteobacterium symbiont of Bathyaustriella thionipta]MCU7948622.1 hypothetical protein [gamma proteobacterium symbiont of Bathyaustriella thionipta]MCU7952873.1 hypothetical protein [gamma proteobacterium symbiont of Bathyaustriella thionipta]MCU7955127.1 hypothetical protein [gamma proteobacterium symbiont of Bathyaustriella thionipta]MCU7966087.1 hypothetical protein [gamma proteobacterium symbiont of Bathyaustriella thionipta]
MTHLFLRLLTSVSFYLFCTLTYAAVNIPIQASQIDEVPIKKIIWTGCGITKKAFMSDIAAAYKEKYDVIIDLKGGGVSMANLYDVNSHVFNHKN